MDKIQELTTKLYSEGVEKGKEEADKILTEAKASEKEILNHAKQKAEQIIANAKKEAAEFKKNTESELKLYASQALEALKTEVINLVTEGLTNNNIKAATEDTAFTQKLITSLAENWSKGEQLTVGVADTEQLKEYLTASAKHLLDNGLKIESINGTASSFVLAPEDGSYKVKFGEEEFISYFKEFFRPQIRKLLFG